MKNRLNKYINIVLVCVLIIANIPGAKSIAGSVGASIVNFAIGLVLGLVLTGVFMFFYNLFFPANKIKLGIPERVTAGLICSILYSVFSKG